MLEYLHNLTVLEAMVFFLVLNLGIVVVSVTSCWMMNRVFRSKQLFVENQPFRKSEVLLVLSSICLNTGISLLGWWLWKHHWIRLSEESFIFMIIDLVLMVMFMDFAMYWTHRFAHHPILYKLVHKLHHRHESTNPISLFVLHPVEVIGFGLLMISFLMIYTTNYISLLLYITLNAIWGTLGHTGVEPFPRFFSKIPLLRQIGSSTFHAGHHERIDYNFGFYTLIWDRLFGTLDPHYETCFTHFDSTKRR